MVKIEVDGKEVEVAPGSMLIEATDKMKVAVPRFCYHKKLSVAANCRMCLVEVEKAPKPMPACATPVTDGMKVFTRSPKVIAAQKSVMEFLLINHPLDCPICDQGGECELQDVALEYGRDSSRYTETKRVVTDPPLGPLIATDMTRCIHCTRCVRFGEEIAGVRELGMMGRGEAAYISTYIEKSVDSEVSGNVIDLCPVGALTAKPSRFVARAWEMQECPSIASHDCWGSNVFVHVRGDEVVRCVPMDNEQINEMWLSDRDRFSYESLTSEKRLQSPMVKANGKWKKIEWETALELVASNLSKYKSNNGNKIAGLISPSSSCEEMYLLQSLLRKLGSNHIEHRLRQSDFTNQAAAPIAPTLGMKIYEIDELKHILLIGSYIQKEVPLAAIRIRNAIKNGATISCINPIDFSLNFPIKNKVISKRMDLLTPLLEVAKSLSIKLNKELPIEFKELFTKVNPSEVSEAIANDLLVVENRAVIMGHIAIEHPDYNTIAMICSYIANILHSKVGSLSHGGNSVGAWLAGAIPHRGPMNHIADNQDNLLTILDEEHDAYILHNIEPMLDVANPGKVLEALDKANFVVACTSFQSEDLLSVADIILPITTFTENEGTYINACMEYQTVKPLVNAAKDIKHAWKVYRVLGNLCDLDGFEHTAVDEVLNELKRNAVDAEKVLEDKWMMAKPKKVANFNDELPIRITTMPLYAVDPVVRHAPSLQQTSDAKDPYVRVNSKYAKKLNSMQSDLLRLFFAEKSITYQIKIDERVPDEVIWINHLDQENALLGPMIASQEIARG